MVDLVSLLALVISLVALVVAAAQLTQQLYATASEYWRYSSRAMGPWARYTHRKFVWKEVRFEVTFSTPRIKINPRPVPYMKQGDLKKYLVSYAPKWPARAKTEEWDSGDSSAWFMQRKITSPQAKCSWLDLLEDAGLTEAQITFEENVSSADYVPKNYRRPLATADRKSFLTLMSLFGIRWENRGEGKNLVGVGDFFEVSAINVSYYGTVLSYTRLPSSASIDRSSRSYHLTSEKARLAMFNHFDLGFAVFNTYDDTELEKSLKHEKVLASNPVVRNLVLAFFRGSQGWCTGLAESITCWADKSMPKVIEKRSDRFKSVFSAVPARSLTTGDPLFVAMLIECGAERLKIPSVEKLAAWAREHLTDFHPQDIKMSDCLKWAAIQTPGYPNNIVGRDISWSMSLDCLAGVQSLDEVLDEKLLRDGEVRDDPERIKLSFSNQQIELGSSLFPDTSQEAGKNGTFWLDELDRVGSANYINVAQYLKEKHGLSSELAQRIVVNRLMRGALWVIHNGNAPDQYVRVLECSLSSTLLFNDALTVYIQ